MGLQTLISIGSVLVASVSITWTIAQSVNKPNIKSMQQAFSQKLDQVLKSITKITDLLHQTRQKYVTKEDFDRRSLEVDNRQLQQTKRFVQKYEQVYDRCNSIEQKLDKHILDWAKQQH